MIATLFFVFCFQQINSVEIFFDDLNRVDISDNWDHETRFYDQTGDAGKYNVYNLSYEVISPGNYLTHIHSVLGYKNIAFHYRFAAHVFNSSGKCKISYSINNGATWTLIHEETYANNNGNIMKYPTTTFNLSSNASNINGLGFKLEQTSVRAHCAINDFGITGDIINTQMPTLNTQIPSKMPTKIPSKYPSKSPTENTQIPSKMPTEIPSKYPSKSQTENTEKPSKNPTRFPTENPIKDLTVYPTSNSNTSNNNGNDDDQGQDNLIISFFNDYLIFFIAVIGGICLLVVIICCVCCINRYRNKNKKLEDKIIKMTSFELEMNNKIAILQERINSTSNINEGPNANNLGDKNEEDYNNEPGNYNKTGENYHDIDDTEELYDNNNTQETQKNPETGYQQKNGETNITIR